MADKFLNTGGSGSANISNGSVNIFAATLAADNLDPSMAIKTNSTKQLVSTNLEIADTNGLTAALASAITTPYSGILQAQDFRSDDYTSYDTTLGKLETELYSTGIETGGIITDGGGTYSVSAGEGHILWAGVLTHVVWGAQSGIASINGAFNTLYINSSGIVVVVTNTVATPESRRENIFLGGAILDSNVISEILQLGVGTINPQENYADFLNALGLFNITGNVISAGGLLTLDKSAGTIFQSGANGAGTNNPNIVTNVASTGFTFRYYTQTGLKSTGTNIDSANYDVAGTITAIAGAVGQWQIQRCYMTSSDVMSVEYGQTLYTSQTDALNALNTEAHNSAVLDISLLRCAIIVKKDATDLTTSENTFTIADRFGTGGAGSSSSSTTSLQIAYNNSTIPQITTDATRGGIIIKSGTGNNNDKQIVILNDADVNVFEVSADGDCTLNGSTGSAIFDLDTDTVNYRLSVVNATSTTGYSSTATGTVWQYADGDQIFRVPNTLNADAYQTSGDAGILTKTGLGGADTLVISESAMNETTWTGIDNIIIGNGSGQLLTTGTLNTVVGNNCLTTATTSFSNTAVGHNALNVATTQENTAVGRGAMEFTVDGQSNTACGLQALWKNVSGDSNVAVGLNALRDTTSNENVGIGRNSLILNSSGIRNTGVGYQALDKNTVSNSSTAVGHKSLFSSTGQNNTSLGADSGLTITTGEGCVMLGVDTAGIAGVNNNQIAIGFQATTTAANQCVIGNNLLASIQPAVNATPICDLGATGSEFDDIYLKGVVKGDVGTGYVFYHGTNITVGSPLVVTAAASAHLLNNGSGTSPSSNITQIPVSGALFFNTTTSLITPEFENDNYSVTVRIDAESTSVNGTFELYLDINTAAVIIPLGTKSFPKGSGTVARFITTQTVFAGSDFTTHGAQVRLLSITGTTTISDYRVTVSRIHLSR